ncbi:MAG: acyl carrier protein [Candidatus Cloacimonetes bacterium]|nr:acyl carrier protein [Candidatus Cloacimonadota bacterium]
MRDKIREVVLDYVIKEYMEDQDEEITYDTALISGGFIDSFSMVSLKVFLETKYQIKLPDDKATPEAFDTVENITDLVIEFLDKK